MMVFARAPVPGRCKTRLAARFGDEAAAELAGAFLRRTVASLAGAGGWELEVHHWPGDEPGPVRRA
ncbi:MAG: hypothetical protein HY303_06300, partial [Candidatus Wallbacteria bacterium]|nr:hypothetical protein [Candidatus Wallbacteria bacterium]